MTNHRYECHNYNNDNTPVHTVDNVLGIYYVDGRLNEKSREIPKLRDMGKELFDHSEI